jgi:hypothetical protein
MKHALDDVPGFVVSVMNVWRSNEARRIRRTAGIAPFSDDEVVVCGADYVACERGGWLWRGHTPQ